MLVKATIFIAVCLVIVQLLTPIFTPIWYPATNTIKGFQQEKDNSIDVLFLGTSRTAFTASPWVLWEEYGITSYSLGIESQPTIAAYYLLLEALKTQTPKAVLMEVQALDRDRNYDDTETYTRESFDILPLSLNKLKITAEICAKSDTQKFSSYVFPLLRYHDRWSDLTSSDFENQNQISKTKGAVLSLERAGISLFSASYPESTGIPYQLPTETEKWFQKMIDLCIQKDMDLVLYSSPIYVWTKEQSLYYETLEEKYENVHFIEFNNYDVLNKINFDITKDFSDTGGHVNYYGAKKMMHVVGDYLSNTLQIPDHRGDEQYISWQECTDYAAWLLQNQELQNSETFLECLPYLNDPRYTVAMVACDDGTIAIQEQECANLRKMGLTADFEHGFRKAYICVIDDSKVLYEKMDDFKIEYSAKISDHTWTIKSVGYNTDIPTEATISIGKDIYRASGWGLMVLVYNKDDDMVVTAKIFGDPISKVQHTQANNY